MSLVANLRKKYSQSNSEAMRNPWVLGWIGLLVLFVGMNIVFIALSIATNPGLVTNDYYEKGRAYEENVVKMIEARNALKWETNLEIPRHIYINKADVVRFTAVDSRGMPIENAGVILHAYRPSDANADYTVHLDAAGPGVYQASVTFPLKGIWDLKLSVYQGDNALDIEHRINVQTH